MILFVDQSGQIGGAELCLADIAAHYRDDARVLLLSEGPFEGHLRERGVKVAVHPLPASMASITKEASPLALAATLPAAAGYCSGLRRAIRSASVLYLNTAKALLYGAAAKVGLRVPAIFHLHDLLEASHFSAMNLRLLVAAANRMDAVIANSRATADAFRARGGRVPVHVIPNGFDPAWADKVPDCEAEALRREFNPEGRPVVALFGRLARWKGQEVLLRAAEQLPEAVFWIVGDALFTGDDRDYADGLKRQAAAMQAREGGCQRVHFLGFRNDVAALMRAADLVAHSSIAPEPFGRVLVEAMLARKPLVATRGGGPSEIIEDGVSGFLVAPGEPDALADAIRPLLRDSAMRAAMGASGRERAERLYTLHAVLGQTATVIESVLQRREAR